LIVRVVDLPLVFGNRLRGRRVRRGRRRRFVLSGAVVRARQWTIRLIVRVVGPWEQVQRALVSQGKEMIRLERGRDSGLAGEFAW
jgi:hypothetical protein